MSTATDIIGDARSYASETYGHASVLIDSAQSKIRVTTPNAPSNTIPSVNITDITWDDPGSFNDRYVSPGGKPIKPTFQGVKLPGDMETVDPVDDFDYSKLWEGDVPIFNIPEFTKTAPEVSPVVIPDPPPLDPIPYPDIQDIVIPEFDGVTIPSFDPEMLATMPDLPPDIVQAYKDTYSDSLPEMQDFLNSGMQEILDKYCPEYEDNRARLIDKINNAFDNGTGLSDTFEQNLYDRGRSRAEAEQIRITTEVQEGAAKRGQFVPDGTVISGLVQAQAQAAMANAQYSSETTIERAKLELNHLEFVMGLSNGIRDTSLQLMIQQAGNLIQINGQALTHSQNIANIMTELYNLEVKRFETALQYLSIQAQVYETEYKAAMANLEIFRIEAEVAKLTVDINDSEVALYTARVGAQKMEVEIYATQVDALNTKVNAEATAVKAFGEEVRAYTSQVQAKTAEFGAYTAALNGNKTQMEIYVAEVNAYATKVNAAKSVIDVEVAAANSVISYNKNLSDQFRAELDAYKTNIQAESTRFESSTKAYISNLETFKATLDAKKATLMGQVKEAELDVNAAIQEYKNVADFRVAYAQTSNQGYKNIAEIATSGAAVYTDIAGAALQAQNTMVQVVES
ncbi:MAG: hypothetical protein DRQ39_03675 [Gammaproteobacteria bacterium]